MFDQLSAITIAAAITVFSSDSGNI